MKNIIGLFIVVMTLVSCSNSEELVVHPTFRNLTSDDSLFVNNVLKMDGGKKHMIMKTDSVIYLTIKHKDYDNVYLLGNDGFIKDLFEIYPDGRTIQYGPESE
jgi:hypothetical protein